jgi:hypothetical protein
VRNLFYNIAEKKSREACTKPLSQPIALEAQAVNQPHFHGPSSDTDVKNVGGLADNVRIIGVHVAR